MGISRPGPLTGDFEVEMRASPSRIQQHHKPVGGNGEIWDILGEKDGGKRNLEKRSLCRKLAKTSAQHRSRFHCVGTAQ